MSEKLSLVIRDIPKEVMISLKEQAEAEGMSREEYLRNYIIALARREPNADERTLRVRMAETQAQLHALFEQALSQ